MDCYNNTILSNNGPKLWPRSEGLPVQPPFVMRVPGRPTKARKVANDESNTKRMKITIVGKLICTTCSNFRHNKRTRIGKITDNMMIPKEGIRLLIFYFFILLYLLFCYDNFYNCYYIMVIVIVVGMIIVCLLI